MHKNISENIVTKAVKAAFDRGVSVGEISESLGSPAYSPSEWAEGRVFLLPQFEEDIAKAIDDIKSKKSLDLK